MGINAHRIGICQVQTIIADFLRRHATKDLFRSNRENIKAMIAWIPDKEYNLLSSQDAFWLKRDFASRPERFEAYKKSAYHYYLF